jgi:hypothetical protein
MTTDNHDALAYGGALTSAAMEAPLAQLDAAINRRVGSVLPFADADIASSGSGASTKNLTAAGSTILSYVATHGGSIIGVTCHCTARTTGEIQLQASVNSTAVGPIAQIDSGHTTQAYANAAPGTYTFDKGDIIGLQSYVNVATYAPITGDVLGSVVVLWDLSQA